MSAKLIPHDSLTELERVAELVKDTQPIWAGHLRKVCEYARDDDVWKEAYRAGLAAAQPAQTEPVAWMYKHERYPPSLTVSRWHPCDEPWTETPLYASPAAQPAQIPRMSEWVSRERLANIVYHWKQGGNDAESSMNSVEDVVMTQLPESPPAALPVEDAATNRILHILRNPHGWSSEDIRAARLAAADMIERLQAAQPSVPMSREQAVALAKKHRGNDDYPMDAIMAAHALGLAASPPTSAQPSVPSAWPDQMTPALNSAGTLSVLDWARERLANSVAIAATTTGADRDGWVEDEAYWRAIIAIAVSIAQPQAASDAMRRALVEIANLAPFGLTLGDAQDLARKALAASHRPLRAQRITMSYERELLPCPFCGSAADRLADWWAQCSNGECDMYVAMVHVRSWNKRAAMTSAPPSSSDGEGRTVV